MKRKNFVSKSGPGCIVRTAVFGRLALLMIPVGMFTTLRQGGHVGRRPGFWITWLCYVLNAMMVEISTRLISIYWGSGRTEDNLQILEVIMNCETYHRIDYDGLAELHRIVLEKPVKIRLCRLCKKPLSVYNQDSVCFHHKEHKVLYKNKICDRSWLKIGEKKTNHTTNPFCPVLEGMGVNASGMYW
jgi:hypothetical protein